MLLTPILLALRLLLTAQFLFSRGELLPLTVPSGAGRLYVHVTTTLQWDGVSCDSGGAFLRYHACGCRHLCEFRRRGRARAPAIGSTVFCEYLAYAAKRKHLRGEGREFWVKVARSLSNRASL